MIVVVSNVKLDLRRSQNEIQVLGNMQFISSSLVQGILLLLGFLYLEFGEIVFQPLVCFGKLELRGGLIGVDHGQYRNQPLNNSPLNNGGGPSL